MGWAPHSTENFLQYCEGFTFLVATTILLGFLFRKYRGEVWMEENSKPKIWVGLVWAGLLTVPTISIRFEIFFCIFPFQYLRCCEGFTFFGSKKWFCYSFCTENIEERYDWNKFLNLAHDLGRACVGWTPHSTNNFHEIWNILLHFSFSVPSLLWRLYFVGGDGIYRSLDITKGKKTNDLFAPPSTFFRPI